MKKIEELTIEELCQRMDALNKEAPGHKAKKRSILYRI